jgi:DNA-binding LacI/PurR family transcriptional regulator
MEAKRATLRDVAAAAGVSRALAGFVLGDDHGKSIPEATRERVREAARSLGYVPTESPGHCGREARGSWC